MKSNIDVRMTSPEVNVDFKTASLRQRRQQYQHSCDPARISAVGILPAPAQRPLCEFPRPPAAAPHPAPAKEEFRPPRRIYLYPQRGLENKYE